MDVTMSVDASLLTYGAIGVLLGGGYFAGLWWTVANLRAAAHPTARLLGSFALRATVAAVALLYVARAGAFPLAAAVAGFLLARTVLVRMWGR